MTYIYGQLQRVEFTTPGTFTWNKPGNISTVHIFCQGAGGGGAGGQTGIAGTNRSGGGGGGGGSTTRVMVPAVALPNTLWITVGSGGAGGAASLGNGGSYNCNNTDVPFPRAGITTSIRGGAGIVCYPGRTACKCCCWREICCKKFWSNRCR